MDRSFVHPYLPLKQSVISFCLLTALLFLGNLGFAQTPPTITAFSPATICQGESITITGTNFTAGATVQLNNVNATNVTVNSATSITASFGDLVGTGKITVVTPDGTVTSATDLTIRPAPKPGLNDVGTIDAPFTNCNGNAVYQLKVSNISTTTGTGNVYEINWGDQTPLFTQTDWPAGAQTTHQYNNQGYFVIVLTITPTNGCKRSISYQFYNGQNPLASFTTTTSTTGLCTPASIEFQIGNWFNNSAGTKYEVNFGDGSPNVSVSHPLNGTNSIYLLSHPYTTSSCPNPDFTATLKAINGCFTTTYTLNQIIIRKKPVADFITQTGPLCINVPVCFTNQSTNGFAGNSCLTNTTFLWDFGDGTTSNAASPGCHTYATAGTYTVTLSASNTSCGADVKTKQIVVRPASPPPVVSATPVVYCKGQQAVPLTATGTNLLWYTSANGGTGNPTAPTPSTNTAGSTTWYVSQTLANACESPRVPITVTVNALPAAPGTAPVQLCQNQTTGPLTATGSNLLWYASQTGGTGSPTAPTPSTTAIGSTTYYVSQTTNNCEGPRAAIVVTVNALAVAPTVTSPITYCQNQTAVALSATGTGLLWYTSATGGIGNATAPTPSTATPGNTDYYVSQATGCGEGPRALITVIVNPGPSATIAYNPSILCNVSNTGSTPNPPIPVILTGTSGGTYSITPATGLTINATNGTIDPSGATSGTYTIRYTIPGSGGCSNFTTTTTVTINRSPSATITYPAICTSDAIANVTLTGSTGGVFSSTTGLTINAATGAITPGTSTSGSYTVTYAIAASAPCPGFTTTANVTITQAPLATISYSPTTLCNVGNTSNNNPPVPVIFTGTTGGSYSVAPTTGLNINTATGTIDPSGATPGTYTIKYSIPGAGGCANYSTTTTVTVNGTPTASITYPAICSADGATPVTRTGGAGGTYSSGNGLSIDPSTGTITPGTSTPGTYTVTYTIAASAPCPGFTTTTNVTITQAPSAAIAYNPSTLCNVHRSNNTPNPAVPVVLTGTTGGSYSISPATGLAIDASGTLDPSDATPGIYTIKYTIPGSGGCANYSTTTTVTVSGTPTATIAYPAICSSDAATNVTITGNAGGTFSSTAGLSINPSTGTITPASSTPGTYVVTYYIAPSAPCPDFTTTTNVTISQAPSATIAYSPASLCNVANTGTNPNPPVPVTHSGTTGGSYSILPTTGLSMNALGTIDPSGATAGTYTIKYTIAGAGGCALYSTSTQVTISNAPTATINYPGSPYCGGLTTPQPVSFSGTTGGTYQSTQGLSLNATTGAINPSLSTPGNYSVTYTIAASAPCPGYVASAQVTINESPVVTFAVSKQTICSGRTAVYSPSSTVANTTFNWSVVGTLPVNVAGTSAGTTSGANADIALSFTNTGSTSESLTIQVIPVNPTAAPCPGAPYLLTLIVNPVPPAPITDTAHFCMGTPPVALLVNPSPGNTIKWYDKNLVLLSGPPIINTAFAARFDYYVSQTNSLGCESPKASIVALVHPTPKIVGSSAKNPTTCGIPSGSVILDVVDLNDNAIPGVAVVVHYLKFNVAQSFSSVTDASGKITIPLTAGTYTDFEVITNRGCTSQKLPDVFILKDPTPPAQPVAGYNPPICSEQPLTLTALTATSTQAGPIDYVWAGPAFGPYADTIRNTVVVFPSAALSYAGTYVVYAIQNNCISLPANFQVVIKQSPSKPVITTRSPLCVGENLFLQATSSMEGNGTLNYIWTGPGTGFPVNASNAAINNVTLSDAGIYSITVSSPQTGCSITTDTLIQIGVYPIVKLPPDTLTLPTGYRLNLVPVIANATEPGVMPMKQYTWTPSQDIICNDPICASAIAVIRNNVCYQVKATNVYGCSGSDTICVKVFCQNSQVFIPNAFVPLGNVPENRILMVRASGIASVKTFRVFNRWGKVVFERNNFPPNSTDFGWDGRVNGKMADTGVYIYTVDVICENGVPYSYKGNVTLL